MEKKFTIEEIKMWLSKQDSFGDFFYNCTSEKIEEANQPDEVEEDEEWK